MRILFIGDIFGRSGRDALAEHLKTLREKLRPDVVIVNGENAAHGKGINPKIIDQFFELGVNCITTGNHVWAKREIFSRVDQEPRLIRPMNYPAGTPGKGFYVHKLPDGRSILIANIMGQVYMDPLDDPFAAGTALLQQHALGRNVNAIFVDFHAEATSEKMAFGHFMDGKASAVVGTHTHVPTADAQILPGGTAYQTDAGMSGDYNSVIGSDKVVPLQKFTRKMPTFERMTPATGEGTVCGVFVETHDSTGLAKSIEPVRIGGTLHATH